MNNSINLISTLFSLRGSVHFTHLTACDWAEHEILGELYEQLNEDLDRVAELYLSYNKDIDIKAVALTKLTPELLARERDMLHSFAKNILVNSLDKEDLKTSIYDTVEHLSKAVYLWRMQKGKYMTNGKDKDGEIKKRGLSDLKGKSK